MNNIKRSQKTNRLYRTWLNMKRRCELSIVQIVATMVL